MSAATLTSTRPPWETRFAHLSATPVAVTREPVRVTPIAIPVVGAPIKGRHLVRAPWTEPLSAFAGVIVETQQVPDDWFRPRTAPQRVMDPPVPLTRSAAAAQTRPIVAIPVILDAPAAPVVPVRVVPVAPGRDAVRARRAATVTALGAADAAMPTTAVPPVEPVVPSPMPTAPAPGRRGLISRAIVLTLGLVVSLVAYEAATRIGRR